MAEFYGFELKEFDTASLSGSFQNLGSTFSKAARYVHIWNTSTVDVYITNNNSTNILRVPAGKDLPLVAYSQHNANNAGSYIFKKGTQLKVKQVTAAAAGAIIVTVCT